VAPIGALSRIALLITRILSLRAECRDRVRSALLRKRSVSSGNRPVESCVPLVLPVSDAIRRENWPPAGGSAHVEPPKI
jgi:hypothetical protein